MTMIVTVTLACGCRRTYESSEMPDVNEPRNCSAHGKTEVVKMVVRSR